MFQILAFLSEFADLSVKQNVSNEKQMLNFFSINTNDRSWLRRRHDGANWIHSTVTPCTLSLKIHSSIYGVLPNYHFHIAGVVMIVTAMMLQQEPLETIFALMIKNPDECKPYITIEAIVAGISRHNTTQSQLRSKYNWATL